MKTKLAIFVALCFSSAAFAQTSELEELKQRIEELEKRQQAAEQDEAKQSGITLGGAARVTYSYEDYSDANGDRGGDFDFDVFRLDANGKLGDFTLSAQYRWYQYMDVLHHAWIGYDFSDSQSGQLGVTQVPFGILPYASHSFFFSSNFYTGLEDDYDMGLNYKFESELHRLDLAFYKNDEQGGIDGYVSERSDRYSYDVLGVRLEGEGIYDAPSLEAGETNTFNVRYARILKLEGGSLELGLSGQLGELEVDGDLDGDHWAAAIHGVINLGPWNI